MDIALQAQPDRRKWMTIIEVAKHFGVSTRTIERLIADGTIPIVRVRRSIRLDPEEVAEKLRKPASLPEIEGTTQSAEGVNGGEESA